MLTILGKSFAGRVAASLLNAVDLSELVVNTRDEYKMLAIELGLNPVKIEELKSRLEANRFKMPLYDTPLFAKNLELAFLKIYERFESGLAPNHIYLN